MQITHEFTVNESDHVVFENGIELGMNEQEYMFTQLLQSYDLEILLAIDRFCKEHDIKYYLAEGTMLGAIRHQGFIPWDDDIDICMLREDYERFLKLAAESFPEEYAIDCKYTNPKHWTIIAQVEMKRPVPYVKERLEGIALYNGPVVDVFPIDTVPYDSGEELVARGEEIHRLRRAMWIKSGLHKRSWYKTFERRRTLYYPLKMYGLTRSLDTLRQEVETLMTKTNDREDAQYVAMFSSMYPVERETFPREWFGEPRYVEFEGHMLPCPAEAEKILTKIYHNYLAMPLIKKRKNKHYFAVDEDLLEEINDQEVSDIVHALDESNREKERLKEEARLAKEAELLSNPDKAKQVKKNRTFLGQKLYDRKKRIMRREKREGRTQRRAMIEEFHNMPIKKDTVFFDAFSGLGVLDSPRAIFKRMLEREEFKDFTYVWAINDESIVQANLDEFRHLPNVKFVDRQGDAFLEYLWTAEYIVSNSSVPQSYYRREGQKYLNTWHGVPTKAMGYDRPGFQRVRSTKNIVHNFLNATHIVSANDFTGNKMYREAYKLQGIYEGKLLDCPLPRTDALYHTDRAYVLKKLQAAGIRVDKKMIIYAPTWKGSSHLNFDTDITQLRAFVKQLREHIDTSEYEVYLRVHYFLYRAIDADAELRQICIPFTVDTNELLSVTDVLISDYSSIFFDFLGTRRPILFHVPDLEEYLENRGLYIGMKDMPGPVCTTVEEIADNINHLDEVQAQYQDKYEAMYQWCSSKEDGHASDRVIDAFILDKEYPCLDCHTDKKKLLILAEWGTEFAARNDVELLMHKIDHDKYDVTLLAGLPSKKSLKRSLAAVDEHVRILIHNKQLNVNRDTRVEVFNQLSEGSIDPAVAASRLQMDTEWRRLVGDAAFDELILYQSPKRAMGTWYILGYYAPIQEKSFIMDASGLKGVYAGEGYLDQFKVYHTTSEYMKEHRI